MFLWEWMVAGPGSTKNSVCKNYFTYQLQCKFLNIKHNFEDEYKSCRLKKPFSIVETSVKDQSNGRERVHIKMNLFDTWEILDSKY